MDKVVLNVAVSIVLVALYIYFFGQHSVQKFLNKSVIITENEEKQDAISPPGIYSIISTYISNFPLVVVEICRIILFFGSYHNFSDKPQKW